VLPKVNLNGDSLNPFAISATSVGRIFVSKFILTAAWLACVFMAEVLPDLGRLKQVGGEMIWRRFETARWWLSCSDDVSLANRHPLIIPDEP